MKSCCIDIRVIRLFRIVPGLHNDSDRLNLCTLLIFHVFMSYHLTWYLVGGTLILMFRPITRLVEPTTYKCCPTLSGYQSLVAHPWKPTLQAYLHSPSSPFVLFHLPFFPLYRHGRKTFLFVSSCCSQFRACPSWYVYKLASDSPLPIGLLTAFVEQRLLFLINAKMEL